MQAHYFSNVAAAALVMMMATAYVQAALPVISIQNNRLLVDNQEFIVKGVAYSPSPIGQTGMDDDTGYGGTGLCSAKVTPYNEWKSACYDSDYFDGSPDPWTPSRFPTGFRPLWERDLPAMKAMGINTIRLYNTNPSTLAATKEYTNLYKVAAGKDHTQFIKYCEEVGLFVVYALFSDEPSWLNMDENVFRRHLRNQIDEVGNSPAVLMWQLGNEWFTFWDGQTDNWNSPVYTAKLNRMLAYIRTYTKTKWNRFIPVTSTMINIDTQYPYTYPNWNVDVFTSNVFGTTFDYQFNPNDENDGITAMACRYNKPFLFTETGPTWKEGQTYTAGTLNKIWYNILKQTPNSLLGGMHFEWTDEPALGKDFGLFGLAVTTSPSGAKSNKADVFVADTLVRKQQYTDLSSGSYKSMPYNYKADVFATLLKRNPYNSTNNPDTCATKYTLKPCPGTSWPKCSGVGNCDRNSGTCTCLPGYSGSSCNVASCSCNGRGVCNTAVYPIECACNPGYWGSQCQYTYTYGVCPGINKVNCTNGNGICAGGVCYCHPGWTGVDCGVTDPGWGSVNVQQFFTGCLQSATFPVTAPATVAITNQKCRLYCALRGYVYAATSNGNTCQCGNTLSTTTTSTSCTSNCAGDATQRCGGSTQFSVYKAEKLYAVGYRGCFPDNATRDLPVQMDSGIGSVDLCRSECFKANYAYTAVQNGGACFCGNFYGQFGSVLSDSECNIPCQNDNTLNCGGSWRNSVYTSWLIAGYQYYL